MRENTEAYWDGTYNIPNVLFLKATVSHQQSKDFNRRNFQESHTNVQLEESQPLPLGWK